LTFNGLQGVIYHKIQLLNINTGHRESGCEGGEVDDTGSGSCSMVGFGSAVIVSSSSAIIFTLINKYIFFSMTLRALTGSWRLI
jgi:hypothetical protein